MKSFETLTARGQARRLRTMALAALNNYDLQISRLRVMTYHFNAIFRVDTYDGSKLVLRINFPNHRTPGNILSEMRWLAALRADTELVVPEPLRNRTGDLVTTVSVDGVPEPRHCVVFGWVPGRDLHRDLTPANYEKLGRFTANLHEHAASWTPKADLDLTVYDKIMLFDSSIMVWDELGPERGMPPALAADFKAAYERASAMLANLYRTAGPPRILHADLHQANIRIHRGNTHALDFDDCLLGHFVQDVGITFYYIQGHPDYLGLRDAYRKGYESVRAWPETAPGQVEGMIVAREILLCQFIYDGANPELRRALKHFLERAAPRLKRYLEMEKEQ